MIRMIDKTFNSLSSFYKSSGEIISESVGTKTRKVIFLSVVMCAVGLGLTLTQRVYAKAHLRSIGGKMREKLGNLFRHFSHLSSQEFEGYINRSINDASLRSIESHLRYCHVCKEEVDIVQRAIREFESGRAVEGEREVEVSPSFKWPCDSILWIDDETYSLKPIGSEQNKVLVENLAFTHLEKLVEEDLKVPGTHFMSIEGKGLGLITPLSEFARIQLLLPFATKTEQLSCRSSADASAKEIPQAPPLLFHESENLTIEVFTDAQGVVLLDAHLRIA